MWVWFLGGEDPLEEEMATPSKYSSLENPMDGVDWWATVRGVAEILTQLSTIQGSPQTSSRQDPHLPLESTLDHLPLALCSPAAQWPPLSCYNVISLLPSATGPLHGLWSLLGLEELSPNSHDSYYSSSAQRHSNTNQSDVSKVNSNLCKQEDKTQDS